MKVFLCHVRADTSFAERLAADLRAVADVDAFVWTEKPQFDAVLPPAERTVLVPVISAVSVSSGFVATPFDGLVLPVLATPCRLPEALGLNVPVDFTESYRHGLTDLLAQVETAREADVGRHIGHASRELGRWLSHALQSAGRLDELMPLSARQFEEAISSTLRSHQCDIEVTCHVRHSDTDLVAVGGRHASLGPWLIQCKRYQADGRFGIESIESLRSAGWSPRESTFSVVAKADPIEMIGKKLLPHNLQPTLDCWHLGFALFTTLVQWLANSPELPSAVLSPVDHTHDRYAHLVERRLADGLTAEETGELSALETVLDEREADFYAPARQLLESQPDEARMLRRAVLIEKRFEKGLSPGQADELAAIDAALDRDEAAFYEPIKRRLREILSAAD